MWWTQCQQVSWHAADAALVDWRLCCAVNTVAAGELVVGAPLVVGSVRTWVQMRGQTGESENPSLGGRNLRRSDQVWVGGDKVAAAVAAMCGGCSGGSTKRMKLYVISCVLGAKTRVWRQRKGVCMYWMI